jgi:hypothetical protein
MAKKSKQPKGQELSHKSGSWSLFSHGGRVGSVPGKSTCDLRSTNSQWDCFSLHTSNIIPHISQPPVPRLSCTTLRTTKQEPDTGPTGNHRPRTTVIRNRHVIQKGPVPHHYNTTPYEIHPTKNEDWCFKHGYSSFRCNSQMPPITPLKT